MRATKLSFTVAGCLNSPSFFFNEIIAPQRGEVTWCSVQLLEMLIWCSVMKLSVAITPKRLLKNREVLQNYSKFYFSNKIAEWKSNYSREKAREFFLKFPKSNGTNFLNFYFRSFLAITVVEK